MTNKIECLNVMISGVKMGEKSKTFSWGDSQYLLKLCWSSCANRNLRLFLLRDTPLRVKTLYSVKDSKNQHCPPKI